MMVNAIIVAALVSMSFLRDNGALCTRSSESNESSQHDGGTILLIFTRQMVQEIALGKNLSEAELLPNGLPKVAELRDPDMYEDENRIVGGKVASSEQFPFTMSIVVRGWHICGGSLIRADLVLTAAHCIYGGKVIDFSVLGGESVPRGRQLIKAAFLIMHGGFRKSGNLQHDIGLVKTRSRFRMTRYVQTIPYATPEMNGGADVDATQLSKTCLVIGWGHTIAARKPAKNNLHYVELPLVSLRECSLLLGEPVTTRQMCTMFMKGGKDACWGDSGGPLVWPNQDGELILQGLVSYGRGCARPNVPAVYTRVDQYAGWISKQQRTRAMAPSGQPASVTVTSRTTLAVVATSIVIAMRNLGNYVAIFVV